MHAATSADPLAASAPSFDQVVAEHLAMISRIAAAHESNLSAREDLVQDILCAVWRALPKFRGEAGLRSFIARIATNRAVTHVQRALRLPDSSELPPDLAASHPGPEACAIAVDERAALVGALCALPISMREPALLALEGFAQQEIAAVLGISPNAVAIRMTRAKFELRKLIGEK